MITKAKLGSMMSFYFFNDKDQDKVVVHVSIDENLQALKVAVDLDGLPLAEYGGIEFIVDFRIEGFDNQ